MGWYGMVFNASTFAFTNLSCLALGNMVLCSWINRNWMLSDRVIMFSGLLLGVLFDL